MEHATSGCVGILEEIIFYVQPPWAKNMLKNAKVPICDCAKNANYGKSCNLHIPCNGKALPTPPQMGSWHSFPDGELLKSQEEEPQNTATCPGTQFPRDSDSPWEGKPALPWAGPSPNDSRDADDPFGRTRTGPHTLAEHYQCICTAGAS